MFKLKDFILQYLFSIFDIINEQFEVVDKFL